MIYACLYVCNVGRYMYVMLAIYVCLTMNSGGN